MTTHGCTKLDRRVPSLPREFYLRGGTLAVARRLLGKILVRRWKGRILEARIVETEAYLGENDPASHAANGPTPRNAPMYGPPGHAYVYFTYGMHHCLNVVTGREGNAEAVLIRAAEPLEGLDVMRRLRGLERLESLLSGPGKLAQGLGLTLKENRLDLTDERSALQICEGPRRRERVEASVRIGISKAMERPWRFYLAGNLNVSGRK